MYCAIVLHFTYNIKMMDVIESNALRKEILEKLQDIDFDIDEYEVSNAT